MLCFFVHTGEEDVICKYIDHLLFSEKYLNYKLLVPKRKLLEYRSGEFVTAYKTMFPGYVLIYTDDIETIHKKLKPYWYSTMYSLLRIKDSYQEISHAELIPILNLINKDGVIDISTIAIEDDKVFVFDGPLTNYSGVITKLNKRKKRIRVVLDFLENKKDLDIGADYLPELDKNNYKNMVLCNRVTSK